jgi:hypothetical protein
VPLLEERKKKLAGGEAAARAADVEIEEHPENVQDQVLSGACASPEIAAPAGREIKKKLARG